MLVQSKGLMQSKIANNSLSASKIFVKLNQIERKEEGMKQERKAISMDVKKREQ